MSNTTKNNLGYLGEDFQYKLVNAFIIRPKLFEDIHTIVNQNMFTETYLRTIVGIMKDFYNKNGIVLGYDSILIELNVKSNDDDEREIYAGVIKKLRHTSTEGIDRIEELAERFFKQQEMIRVANEIRIAAGDGDLEKYDQCYNLFEHVMNITRRKDNSSHPLDSVEDDLSKESIVTIPTGIDSLDEGLGGGIDKGKVGIIIGSMGFGKTSMTTCIAGNAATCKTADNDYSGYKVLQIIFEDTHRDIHRKYFSKISQIETSEINASEENVQKVRESLNSEYAQMTNDNIYILRLPSGEKTASDIKAEIKRIVNEGFNPDMVIIDYFGCIAPERGYGKEDITDRESKTMRKFETMAAELNMAFWIPVQGNRDSISAEIVTNDKIGGSIAKNQIAQVVISITRTVDDIRNNRATLTILKNRSGKAGLTVYVTFNNGTNTITSDIEISFDESSLMYDDDTEKEKELMKSCAKEVKKKKFKISGV